MSPARKGRRTTQRGSNRPSEASGSRLQRAQTLAEQILDLATGRDGGELTDDVLGVLENLVDKVTRDTSHGDAGGVLLVNELVSEPDNKDQDPESEILKPSPAQSSGLQNHVLLGAGRASVHVPRENYFPPVHELDPEEQLQRSMRTSDANLRKAITRARDLAVAEDCGLWATLTVDDLHEGQVSPKAVSKVMNAVSRKYRRQTGQHLHYVAVIGTHGRGPHVHVLFSRDLDPDTVREIWPFGSIAEIVEIPEDEIETKVRYMADNIREHRVSHGRFMRSRGGRLDRIVLPVASVEEARAQLIDLIGPDRPTLIAAQPFGVNPHYSFRFKPVRREGDG